MRSAQLVLDRYDTDKVANRYLDLYDPILEPLVERELTLLEIGIHRGGSLLLWRDYFPRARIVGVDVRVPPSLAAEDRIEVFEGSQSDTAFLSSVARDVAPDGFDVVIDDASHIAALTRISFWHLFDNHLKPGGLYAIEDWGTGYWDDWPDGRSRRSPARLRATLDRARPRLGRPAVSRRSHPYGMVGFVKELVDEQGATDLTRRRLTAPPGRPSKFERLLVMPSIVFVWKRPAGQT